MELLKEIVTVSKFDTNFCCTFDGKQIYDFGEKQFFCLNVTSYSDVDITILFNECFLFINRSGYNINPCGTCNHTTFTANWGKTPISG